MDGLTAVGDVVAGTGAGKEVEEGETAGRFGGEELEVEVAEEGEEDEVADEEDEGAMIGELEEGIVKGVIRTEVRNTGKARGETGDKELLLIVADE